MNLFDWLDSVPGRTKQLAEHLDITASAVTQWRANGIPLSRMRQLVDFTAGEVTLEDMVPPSPEDVAAPKEGEHATA